MRLGRARRPLLSTTASLMILSGLLPVASAVPALAAGSVSLTTIDATYAQDFDTLASTGTANTAVPPGWAFAESGTNANTTYRAGTGSDNAGDTYSFGSASSAERSFGGLRSGSLVPLVGALFTNATGSTISTLDIAYAGEQWRLGQNTADRPADRLDFQISMDATSLSTGLWADVNDIDFASPVVAGTVGTLDGNAAANRTLLSVTIAVSIADGAGFWIRWADSDIPGSDDGLAVDDFRLTPRIADGAPEVAASTPADGATNAARNATISVTFSEPVDLAPDGVDLSCSTSGPHPATIAGGPTTWTIDPDTDFAFGETCTVTITAGSVTDLDATDPPDAMADDATITFATEIDTCTLTFTRIGAIQGGGETVATPGQVVTQGVVVGDYEGAGPAAGGMRGFYIQDPISDGDAATSDGIFIFEPDNLNRVAVGDLVAIRGGAGENQGQSQITSTDIRVCGTGTIVPTPISLPQPSTGYFERYEGMLVTFGQTLSVTETFQLGRFGQAVLSVDGRQWTPTAVAEPGTAALAIAAANALGRVIVDDNLMSQNPDPIRYGRNGNPLSAANTLRIGDTATDVTGVLGWTWAGQAASGNAWRVRPLGSLGASVPDFQPTNPRRAPPAVEGSLHVAAMNVLNYFTTLDVTSGGGPCGPSADQECRGANTSEELARQRAKILEAMVGLDADVIGLMELQNDDDIAIADLVDGLRTRSGNPAWDVVHTGTIGTDAIKLGIVYDASTVTPAGAWATIDSTVDPRFLDTKNRPSLAQTFDAVDGGGRLTVVVNHLKSKGSDCLDVGDPDLGDGSGNCNGTRTQAARALVDWIKTDPTHSGDRDVLVVGDLNSYAKEGPIDVFIEAGYQNAIERFGGANAYSYVFNGQTGYLDHALASPTLAAQLGGAAEWHINADEPVVLDYNTEFKTAGQVVSLYAPDAYRASDHDPLVVGMNLLNYDFAGFQAPIANVPAVNVTKAGAGVPVKFQLSGDLGLGVLFGTPTANRYSCSLSSGADAVEATSTGNSGLQYDTPTNTYSYVWRTQKAWANQCRTFEITFDDGAYRTALFNFTK